MPAASRIIIINATPAQVYSVISDYESYPEFLGEAVNVENTQIISRNGNTVTVRYTVNMIKRVQYTLKLIGTPDTGLTWTLVESSIMKSNVGGWVLRDLGDGRTEATYSVEVVPSTRFIPRRVISMLTEQSLPATLEAFKKRIETLKG